MAEEKDEILDEKARKKELKAQKKAEKKRAKEKKDELELEEETSVGGKIAIFFVTLIIFLIWLAIIVLLIKWDVGGFGSGVLAPVLKNVPYVNRILPDSVLQEESTEDSTYAFATMEDAVNRIKELELQLAETQNTSNANAEYIAQLEGQAAELAQYKQEEAEFEAEKQRFYEEIVFGEAAPELEEYMNFYESIEPANAEIIYRQVVEQNVVDKEREEYIKSYASMKPKEAAAIFDTMTDDLDLVADILMHMDAQSRADILGKMNSETAAKVTEIMEPSE